MVREEADLVGGVKWEEQVFDERYCRTSKYMSLHVREMAKLESSIQHMISMFGQYHKRRRRTLDSDDSGRSWYKDYITSFAQGTFDARVPARIVK